MTEEPPADIRLSFDRVPDLYDNIRPGYPRSFFDRLFAAVPPPALGDGRPQVLEVGPGTGQATDSLLRAGAHVTAVEIGPALATFLRDKFTDDNGGRRLVVRNQPFETVEPDDGLFDAVVSATAHHWIEAGERTSRPFRLLRPDGVLAVISLVHVAAPNDRGYFDRVQPIYASFGDHRHDWTPPTHETARPTIVDELEQSPQFTDVELHREMWDQTYTADQYRELLLTYSGTQMMAPAQRRRLVDQLVAVVVDEYDGVVTRPLSAVLTMARAVSSPRSR